MYKKSNSWNVPMYSITCAFVPSMDPVSRSTDFTISLSDAIHSWKVRPSLFPGAPPHM